MKRTLADSHHSLFFSAQNARSSRFQGGLVAWTSHHAWPEVHAIFSYFCCRWLLQEWMACSSILALAGVDRNLCWFEAQSLGLSTMKAPAAETCVPVASHLFSAVQCCTFARCRPPTDPWWSSLVTFLFWPHMCSRNCEQASGLVGLIRFNISHTHTITDYHTLIFLLKIVELSIWCSIYNYI